MAHVPPTLHKSPHPSAAEHNNDDTLITSAKRKRGMCGFSGALGHLCRCAESERSCRVVVQAAAPATANTVLTGADPTLASPTTRKNVRVEGPTACNPRSLAKIFLGNGQVGQLYASPASVWHYVMLYRIRHDLYTP